MTVGRPITGAALGGNFLLIDVRLIGLPETEIDGGTTGQVLQYRVESQTLNLVVVTVL